MTRNLFSLEGKSIQVFQKMAKGYSKTPKSVTMGGIKKNWKLMKILLRISRIPGHHLKVFKFVL